MKTYSTNLKKILLCFSLLLFLGITACNKQDAHYKDFIKDGEIVYVGKIDSIIFHPGYNRVKLSWPIPSDPSVQSVKIFWNSRNDSSVINMHDSWRDEDTVFTILEDLQEGAYTFELFTYDKKNHSSVVSEVSGNVYGENYLSLLLQRQIQETSMREDDFMVKWRVGDDNLIGTEIKYKNKEGGERLVFTKSDENESLLIDWEPNSLIEYRSLYLPDSLAIDTFYTSYKEMKILRDPPPGERYNEFPEDFENIGAKTTYAAAEVEIGSGTWLFDYFLIGTAAADRKNGERSARSFQGQHPDGAPRTSILEMKDELTYGASKLTFYHAICSSDDPSTFKVQASINGGEWEDITGVLHNDTRELVYKEIELDIKEPVRFRFYKFSSTEAGREEGRMNIDDISVYSGTE